jgi:hypothetical protein
LKTSLRFFLGLIFFVTASAYAVAQNTSSGVRGVVKSNDDGLLPFATIFVKQNGSGTTTNEKGVYEIELAPGWYDLVFQFLGYETTLRKVEITNGFIQLDVIMKPQPTILPEFVTGGNAEDPAYTIMRKAIAKANYHRNELDWYSARVYIKGVGKLKDYPWLAKKAVEKEGIKKNQAFVSESVSDIKYTRPNKFEEKVISIRSDGKDNNTSPNQFVFGSFYEPMIAETVSPLSPKAFSYYKFEYLGTFKDREYDVSRIKVTPRSKGDDVVDGEILIVENWWSIHSVDLHTTKLGIDIWVKMMSAPVEDKVWLPVSHRFKVDGKFFGFEFEYNYLATVSNYKIQVNPKVYVETKQMEVVDEKIEKEEAKEIEKKYATAKSSKQKAQIDKTKELQERLSSGKEITRKELNTLMKEYEKEEIKKSKEPEVVSNTSFKIDSGAYKKDSVYWTHVRPVPLTIDEVVGYKKMDSIAEVKRKEEAGDTLKASKHKGFQPWDLLIGDNYKVGKHSNFRIDFPMPGFNTVEGFNLVYRVAFGTILQDTNKTRFTISPTFRYAFSREKLSGNLAFVFRNKNFRFELSGGRYIKQYNADEPILPVVNTLTTLFLEENLMKIYERDYVDLKYRQKLSDFVTINTSWSYMTRRELFDSALHIKWVDRKGDEYGYTPNRPVNAELASTGFNEHQAFIASVGIAARPWLKFRIRNERRIEIQNSSPLITLDYRKGLNVLGSDVDFDQIELGLKHEIEIGVRGDLTFALRGGIFLNSSEMYFMDYKHFLGNRTPFSTTDPVGSFRLLDYYNFSTSDKYFAGNVHYHFRKFMVTRIPVVRLTGIRENIFVNYLATHSSRNYTEVGYGIDGILRLFRLEIAAAFRDGQYLNYGFRIGIATSITANFSD